MWAAIQSVYNGTWGSGAIPQEIVDFEICREMHLSWSEYQDMPAYVRRVWWDCIMAMRDAEEEQHRRQSNSRDDKQRLRW